MYKKDTCREFEIELVDGDFNKYDYYGRYKTIRSIIESLYGKYKTKILEDFQLDSIDSEHFIRFEFKSELSKARATTESIMDVHVDNLVKLVQLYSNSFVYYVGKLNTENRLKFTGTCEQLTAAIISEYEEQCKSYRAIFAKAAMYRPLKVIPSADFVEGQTMEYADQFIEEISRQFSDMAAQNDLSKIPAFIAETNRRVATEKGKLIDKVGNHDSHDLEHLDSFVLHLNAIGRECFLSISQVC